MSTTNELKEILKDSLEKKGTLNGIRARIRAEIFNTLNDRPTESQKLSQENMIINELIREYMEFNGYSYSLSVFLPESGQPEQKPFNRDFITRKLKVVEDESSKEIPLLYSLAYGSKRSITNEPENFNPNRENMNRDSPSKGAPFHAGIFGSQ